MNNLHNPKNMTGMGNILADPDEDFDIDAIERAITQGTSLNATDEHEDIGKNFNAELQNLSKRYGVVAELNKAADDDMLNWHDNADDDMLNQHGGADDDPIITIDDEYSPQFTSASRVTPHATPQLTPRAVHQPSLYAPLAYHPTHNDRDQWASRPVRMTEEEMRQSHIDEVIRKLPAGNDEDERLLKLEDEEDDMARILEQIDVLTASLTNEGGIDLSRIPKVTSDSSKQEARSVLKILQIKNDRLRYCDMFEEGILAAAYALENVFDGKKEWFNTKIDLVGWPETVKVKLRRMRYNTSSFVSDVMRGYSVGHGWRIIFELLPSLFLYSRDRRLRAHDNLVSDESYKDAIRNLES